MVSKEKVKTVYQYLRTTYYSLRELPRDNEIPEGCANDVFVELSHAKKEEDT